MQSDRTRAVNLICPASNGLQYADPMIPSRVYQIECDTDHYDSDMRNGPVYAGDLEDCIAKCDAATGCQSVVMTGSACYLKYGVNKGFTKKGLSGARCLSGCQAAVSTSSSTSTAEATTSASVKTSTMIQTMASAKNSTTVP